MILKKKTGFVIFCQARSGSTLLKQLLNSHPDINCEGELLNIKENYITNPILIRLSYKFPLFLFALRKRMSRSPVYGFTLLHAQLKNPKYILTKLEQSGWKIIHINRENAYKQILSRLVAAKTNHWHNWEGKEMEVPNIKIDPNELIFKLRRLINKKEYESSTLSKLKHKKVNYEANLSDELSWQDTTKKLYHYLGLEDFNAHSNLKKTYARPYSEIIENYDELIKAVKNSPYSSFLNDD